MPVHAGQVCIPWVLILTHPFKHTPEFGHGTGVCTCFLFSCEERCTPCYAPDKAKSMECVHSYRCEHICARTQEIVLVIGLQVCSKMRLTTLCRCWTKKKNSSVASKMQKKKSLNDWVNVVLSSNYKPMKQMLRHQGRSIICVGLLVVALSIWVYVFFFFHRVWLFSHAMSQ